MITSYGSYSGDESDSEDEKQAKIKKKKELIMKTSPPPIKKKVKEEKTKTTTAATKLSRKKEKQKLVGPQLPTENMEVDKSAVPEMGPQLPPDYLMKLDGNPDSPHSPALASLVAYGPDDDYEDDNRRATSPKDKKHLTTDNKKSSGPLSNNKISKVNEKDKKKDPKIDKKQEEMLVINRQTDAQSTLALKKLKMLKHKAECDDSSSSSSSDESETDKEELEEDGEDDDEEIDENVIISRLRSQANILKELGGEIPDSIKELISEDRPTSFSLIAGNFILFYIM